MSERELMEEINLRLAELSLAVHLESRATRACVVVMAVVAILCCVFLS
jgi:hypothetical protein